MRGLHAFVDGHLPAERQTAIAAFLAARPDDAQRVETYRAQKRELHALFDPVLDEQPPQRLLKSAGPRTVSPTPWYLQRLAAGLAIAVISGDDDPAVMEQARQAGAQGFIHKQAAPETFGLAVEALLSGLVWFEPGLQGSQPPRRSLMETVRFWKSGCLSSATYSVLYTTPI